jgi:hypothetical protein
MPSDENKLLLPNISFVYEDVSRQPVPQHFKPCSLFVSTEAFVANRDEDGIFQSVVCCLPQETLYYKFLKRREATSFIISLFIKITLLVGKSEGKRPLRRPRSKFLYIVMDLENIGLGGVDWISLTQDRGQLRALVKAVVTLRAP